VIPLLAQKDTSAPSMGFPCESCTVKTTVLPGERRNNTMMIDSHIAMVFFPVYL
jgi:hypothetical protein